MGNHDFDFGPDVLADFIEGFSSPVPFLSANLDFSQEPRLQSLVEEGRIASSVVIEESGELIGIIGASTPELPFISSPGDVVVNDDVANAVQAEADRLEAMGVNIIILISHLQSVEVDLDLIPLLSDVDIVVAGGGHELLADPEEDLLIPGDEEGIFRPYPILAEDADGQTVPVITTSGYYRYVGRLVVDFNDEGEIIDINEEESGPIRVAGGDNPDAVEPNPDVQAMVTEPVEAAVAALASDLIGFSEVNLDGLWESIRTIETNEGNLIADALLFQATELALGSGDPLPDVAIQNGGGIRNDSIIPPGNLTELDTFNILPFPNFVAIVPNISPSQFKEIMENAVSSVEFTDGRFAQISGFSFVWDANGTPQELDENGNVVTPGTRVREVMLEDGTQIVTNGEVVPGAPPVNIATIDFLANGGGQYPFRDADFTRFGVTYQQALLNYIVEGVGGVISATSYPVGGQGRITRLN